MKKEKLFTKIENTLRGHFSKELMNRYFENPVDWINQNTTATVKDILQEAENLGLLEEPASYFIHYITTETTYMDEQCNFDSHEEAGEFIFDNYPTLILTIDEIKRKVKYTDLQGMTVLDIARYLKEFTLTKVYFRDDEIEKLDKSLAQDVRTYLFTPHGTYTVSNTISYEVEIDAEVDEARVNTFTCITNWLDIETVMNEEGESEMVIDPQGYNIPLSLIMVINR